MKNLFSIGEVSKIKGITIKALRYYHKVGILIPKYIDDKTGYRYYSIEQFIYIDIIKVCRNLGTSISELQDIFNKCNTEELLEFLKIKKYEAKENINKMKYIINSIDNLTHTVKNSKNILSNKNIKIEFFEKRYIITSPCKEVGSLRELIYYSDLDKSINDKNLIPLIERGIIYEFNTDCSVVPKYVFNVVEYNNSIKYNDNIKILPEGNYLTFAYNKNNENECKDTIINYINKHNLTVKECIEIDLVDDLFGVDNYSCQIQILIEDN